MNDSIVMRRETANSLQAYQQITLSSEEEGFLLMQDGKWKTILPGQSEKTPENARGLLCLRRRAEHGQIVGVGGVRNNHGLCAGGFGEYACRMLSARRFVQKHKDALLGGTSAEEVLTGEVRAAMRAAFESILTEAESAQEGLQPLLALRCVSLVSQRLTENGWALTDFYLKHVHLQKEAV